MDNKFLEQMIGGSEDGRYIYSHEFFYRICMACNDTAGFILELAKNGNNKPVWFCWRTWEKPFPDYDTIKWIVYDPKIERDWPLP